MTTRPKRRYTIAEAVEISGLSRATLYRARAAGRLQMVEHEGRVFVEADELERYMGGAKPLPSTGAPRRGGLPRKPPKPRRRKPR